MKSIILAISILMGLFVSENKLQDFDYEKAWKEVEEMIANGQPKSAISKIEAIFQQAKSEKNDPQLIKSIVFLTRLTIQTDEKGIELSISKLENIVNSYASPVKEISSSYLAELYQRYFDMHRYEISQRSEMTSTIGPDFRLWTTNNFMETIESYYWKSLENKNTLHANINLYKPIIEKYDDEALMFKPSLFEVLADRAMIFFNNHEYNQAQNEQSFVIDNPKYLSDATSFSTIDLDKSDPNSSKFKMVKLYQDIIKVQLSNKNTKALAKYDLERLEYVFENMIHEDKDSLYQTALEFLAKGNEMNDYYTEIMAVLATQVKNKAADSLSNVKAIEICDQAIKAFPLSIGAAKCKNIIASIKAITIQVFGEQVFPNNRNLLFAIQYNNIKDIELSTIKLDKSFDDLNFNGNQDQVKAYLQNAKPIITSSKKLSLSTTYHSQTTEVAHSALEYGKYALVITSLNKNENVFQYLIFNVSELTYSTYLSKDARTYIVSNRITGLPEENVNVGLYVQNYDPTFRKYQNVKIGDYKTDHCGRVVTQVDKNEKNTKVILTKQTDTLDLNQHHGNYRSYENVENKFAEFFTDRSIYRPGQTVYFKSILLKNSKNNIPSILPKEKVNVYFRDANYQEISELALISNEFGSVNGSFVIPTGKLNGYFSLELRSQSGIIGQKGFSVEEYKRPSFEVTGEPIIGEYQLGEDIKVNGFAKTFAGTNVDGAKFLYKVTRNAQFPCWPWYWRSMMPQSPEYLITEGEGTTNEDGKYELSFKAIPDLSIKKSDQPSFQYQVTIDVTDQRGETRSTTHSISLAYVGFTLNSNLDRETDRKDLKSLVINAINTNGQNIDIKGNYTLSLLVEPKNVKVEKYWENSTVDPIPSPYYDKEFPHYPSTKKDHFSNWPVSKKVVFGEFKSKDTVTLVSDLSAGVYKLEMTAKDKNGNLVTSNDFVIVTDFDKKSFPKTDFLFTKLNKSKLEPGETLELQFGAADKSVYANVIIEKDGNILYDKNVKIKDTRAINFPIIEQHRGGINIKVNYVLENRNFEKSFHIDVPWSQKQLDITFETFRDKALPGQKETYNIKIKGKNQDKIAAEMVAAMYDASLDEFVGHQWRQTFYPNSYSSINIETPGFRMTQGSYYWYGNNGSIDVKTIIYPVLMPLIEYNNYYGGGTRVRSSRNKSMAESPMMADMSSIDGIAVSAPAPAQNEVRNEAEPNNTVKEKQEKIIQPRKNLNETVFFFPELKTDSEGSIILSYTNNEALTKWKLMSFAHTKDFMTGYDERYVQTQKNLMVFPNMPRFVRDGDEIELSAKVTNLSDDKQTGKATLKIFDALTLNDITEEFITTDKTNAFEIEKGRSSGLFWKIKVPETKYSAITIRISADAGNHTDAEENTIPVVTNRMLVTESMPMWIKGNETKSFNFAAFLNNTSKTKKDFTYTFEYTSNPIWYAIQALPYIQNQNEACTQTIIDRVYTNTLASKIANAHPKIKSVFDQWNTQSKDALLSNLSKNQDLKSAILEETPWVGQALSEAEQKRNIALLFDLNKLADERVNGINKLVERQLSNGGFPWFIGGPDEVYTTQNILENIGHLNHLGAIDYNENGINSVVNMGLKYIDDRIEDRYNKLKEQIKKYGGKMEDNHLDGLSIHYLYLRTFFKDYAIKPSAIEARNYYFGQASKYWLKQSIYVQAMIGIILHRNNDKTYESVIKSLRERSFFDEELGMYWNEGNGFYWYQLPIERHAMMIEFFSEASLAKDEVDKMKIWLIKNKQTTHWKTSKATAAALYALMLQGEKGDISQWVTENNKPTIKIGKETIESQTQNIEAGTGYFKKVFKNEVLPKELADIKITNNNSSVAWGAAYYQYFEQLDNIKSFADTPLKLNKKYYRMVSSSNGEKLDEIKSTTVLKPGDKVKVRIELVVDRPMEYVHLKDMRPSGFEPTNVISGYKYQGQLGYYESTKDLATDFFISYLPKGSFVFEYPLIVVQRGDFSGGISTIQSMYAPEFSSHSEGSRVIVK